MTQSRVIQSSMAALAIIAIAAAVWLWQRAQETPIKIGAVLSMSGSASTTGEEVRDGMLLAIDEINAWGGVNGKKLRLIVEDSNTDPEEGKKVFNKIEQAHHPLLYVSVLSSVSMALAPLAAEHEVVLGGLLASTLTLTEHNDWVFKYSASRESDISSILSTLQDLKVKSLGILYLNDAYGTPVFELLKEGFEKTGGTVRQAAFGGKTSDFTAHIAQLQETGAICSVGFPAHLKQVFQQLKEENFQGILLGGTTATNPSVRNIPEADGVYTSAPIIYNPKYLFAKEAGEKYTARYKKPFSHEAGVAYDFVKLLAGLLEDQEISRENVQRVLDAGCIYPGVFGDIHVKAGDHNITFPLHPVQIVDGELKYLR